ncbi:LysR family transcriptional regulator [Acinetobacter oleivorans]|uniref:LysR family transcriptional regulator n=1 Tax=Acinetobacter oleivorans TaxID=1148157 RepID=UPI001CD65F89|nr:LysR family transcriptional regulator [Acinetobacter oleivorans]
MDKLDCINAFISVVENGNFSKAAHKLNISRDQVSKRIFHLENTFGTSLFIRNTRNMNLTSSGQKFYGRCKIIEKELELAENDFIFDQKYPEGVLTINAPHSFTKTCFPEIISKFKEKYPRIIINVLFSDNELSTTESNFDIILKIEEEVKEKNSHLIDTYYRRFYGTTSYFKKNKKPETIKDLTKHNIFLHSKSDLKSNTIISPPKLICNNSDILLDFCKKDKGLIFLPEFLVKKSEYNGEIIRCLDDFYSSKLYFYAIIPYAEKTPKKIQVFLECVKDFLSNPETNPSIN